MKKTGIFLVCLMAVLLAGCGVHVNVNKEQPDIQTILENKELIADPADYNPDGSYSVTFHYETGGFKNMDLSQAYVAYYPYTIMDQVESITGDDSEDIPALPADVQNAMDDATGANQLQKIAIVAIETIDDNTLVVSFTDKDSPVKDREYFFLIPNEELSGSFIPESD